MKDIRDLFQLLQIETTNPDIYRMALTHASYRNEHSDGLEDYDRLEFVGDSVLDLVIADLLYLHYGDFRSGKLSKFRSLLVKGTSLARKADEINLLSYAFLSNGETRNFEDRDRLGEDMYEALLGAMYLDKGYEYTYNFIKEQFLPDFSKFSEDDLTDSKSKLQELLQKECPGGQIIYRVVSEEGTAQNKHYLIEVTLSDVVLGTGEGGSKKSAEQAAALDALKRRIN